MNQLDLMIRAHYPILYLVAVEEAPIEDILRQVAAKPQPERVPRSVAVRAVLLWDIVRGWSDNSTDKGSVMGALGRIVKLPSDRERQEIFKIYLQRLRPSRLREFDCEKLA